MFKEKTGQEFIDNINFIKIAGRMALAGPILTGTKELVILVNALSNLEPGKPLCHLKLCRID